MDKKALFRIVLLLLGIWIILLLLFYFSGNRYKEHALIIVQNQLEEKINTEIHLQKNGIQLSILRNFPYAGLKLNNILVKSAVGINQNDFNHSGKDTLLFAEEISLLFNLASIITKKYELKGIVISDAKLNILADNSGNKNYRVFKHSDANEISDSVEVKLKSIHLINTEVNYIDAGQNLYISGYTKSSKIAGEFLVGDFDITLESSLENVQLSGNGKIYFDNTEMEVGLSLKKSDNNYHFRNGNASLMGIELSFKGIYDYRNKNYEFSGHSETVSITKLSYPTWQSFLKQNKIESDKGSMEFTYKIAGVSSHNKPSINSEFIIQKAGFKSLMKKITVRNISLRGRYIRNFNGLSSIEIDTFSMDSDKSKIAGSCTIQNLKNPDLKGDISGILELNKLMLFNAVSNRVELDGEIQGNLSISGSLSSKRGSWSTGFMRAFKKGQFEIVDGYIRPLMNPLPAAKLNGFIKVKGLSDVWFENVGLKTGGSDLLINGSVTDLPIFSGDKSIFPVYRCTVKSDEFHVEDFIPAVDKDQTSEEIKVQLPDSMIVFAELQVDKFYFGKFSASNGQGKVYYQPKVLRIKEFSMESQQGRIHSEITLTQNRDIITTISTADFQQVDLGDLFYAFNNFGQQVIGADNLDGLLTGSAVVHANWDLYMNPILEDLKLQSSIYINNGELIEYQPLLGLAKFIDVDELRHIDFEKLETSITIDKETVYISETNISSSALSLIGAGEHDFRNAYKYSIQVQLSDLLWKKAKKQKPENTEFGYIVDDGLGKTTIPLIISGQDTEYEVYYDRETSSSNLRERIRHEKEEFRSLIRDDKSKELKTDQQEIRLEWMDDTLEIDEVRNTESKSNREEEESQEFIIEWDDD